MPYCNQCGSELVEGSRFCSQCGAAIQQVQSQEAESSQEQNNDVILPLPEESVISSSAEVDKKPFYAKGWFIALVVVALIAIVFGVGIAANRYSFEKQPILEILASYGDFEETTISGNGDDIIDIPCAGSPCLMDFKYEGVYHDYGYGYSYTGGVCTIRIVGKKGNELGAMAHRLGPFSGTFVDWGVYEEAAALRIDAEGDWSVTFRPISTMGYAENGESFEGSNVVAIDADTIREVSFTHDGSSNFLVVGVGTRSAEELVNTVGLFKGTLQWNQPKAFFAVIADGTWTIEWS